MKLVATLALLTLSTSNLALAKMDTYKVDTATSKLNWIGKKITGEHNGTLMVKGGTLSLEKDLLKSGEIEIDMTSLKDLDLTDAENNKKLTDHLSSDDFFSIQKFPTSSLKITKVEKGTAADSITISGSLTIKGITNPISFPATYKAGKDSFEANAKISIDRTKYDIKYRSGRFFPELGDKIIRDEFVVDVHLISKK